MKAISINPQTQSVEEVEIEMQANTVYTFFSSISIDEFETIKEHTLYTDANASSQAKTPYFLGGQLLVGQALIIGGSSFEPSETSISIEDVNSLLSYETSDFYKAVFTQLAKSDINLYRKFSVNKENEKVELNPEWVFETFNIADDKTKEYFLKELSNSLGSLEETNQFIQKMAQLAINAI